MSTLKVETVLIDSVEPIKDADRIEVIALKGWRCVVKKGDFNPGDQAIYFPIDSILPLPLVDKLGIGSILRN